MSVTKAQLIAMKGYGALHHVALKNRDKTPVRARLNGKLKLWVTRPNEFRQPMKHGMYTYFCITQVNCEEWSLPNE